MKPGDLVMLGDLANPVGLVMLGLFGYAEQFGYTAWFWLCQAFWLCWVSLVKVGGFA